MSGRWGGRSSEQAGTRDFRRIARDENETEKRRREAPSDFNGKQGERRPPHSTNEHANGMSPEYTRGYDCAMTHDGSRFELRYIATEGQPWHVVDSDAGDDPEKGPADKVKKFNSQTEAEQYILEQHNKALEDVEDNRSELHYRVPPKQEN